MWLPPQIAGIMLSLRGSSCIMMQSQFLHAVEVRQHPEQKDVASHSPMYKNYCAQWNSPVLKNREKSNILISLFVLFCTDYSHFFAN